MQGRAAEAIACYEHVALLQPESAEAHANLASCYKDAARQDTAITSYRRALQLRPDFPEAFANLVHSLQCVCEWRDRPALFQRMEVEVGAPPPCEKPACMSENQCRNCCGVTGPPSSSAWRWRSVLTSDQERCAPSLCEKPFLNGLLHGCLAAWVSKEDLTHHSVLLLHCSMQS